MNNQSTHRTAEPIYYADQAIFEQEKALLFPSQLFCIGHTNELPHTGDFKRVQLFDEDILLVKQSDKSNVALANRCLHRGATLESESTGCKKQFTCPYHTWQYSNAGTLTSTRNLLPQLENKTSLPKYPLIDLGGLQLISTNTINAEHLNDIEKLAHYFNFYGIAQTHVSAVKEYQCQANWKIVTENFLECYHCAPNHPQLSIAEGHAELLESGNINAFLAKQRTYFLKAEALGHPAPAPQFINSDKRHYSVINGVHLNPPRATGSSSGELIGSLLGKQTGIDHGFIYGSLGPFVHFTIYSDYAAIFCFEPISATQTNIKIYWLTNPDFNSAHAETLTWLWHNTILQDNHLCELVQQQVKSTYAQRGYYTDMEADSASFSLWYQQHFINQLNT